MRDRQGLAGNLTLEFSQFKPYAKKLSSTFFERLVRSSGRVVGAELFVRQLTMR